MKLSQPQKVAEFLKAHPTQKFTAREIALGITKLYPNAYLEKRSNSRFSDEEDFLNQVRRQPNRKPLCQLTLATESDNP